MATPTLVSATNMTLGVGAAESGINIARSSQSWNNPKEYVMDRYGGRTGFATDYDPDSTISSEGEANTVTYDLVMGVAFASASTVANSLDGYGVSSGGWYLDDITLSHDRGTWVSASLNHTRIPGLT